MTKSVYFLIPAAMGVFALVLWMYASSTGDIDAEIYSSDASQRTAAQLDGMTFSGALGPTGKPKDRADIFVFENGSFVSKECELLCNYPASPYFVRSNGYKTEFISETVCPHKDAKIVWRGTVEGNKLKGSSTWVIKRWYWTMTNTFEFEGTLLQNSFSNAGSG